MHCTMSFIPRSPLPSKLPLAGAACVATRCAHQSWMAPCLLHQQLGLHSQAELSDQVSGFYSCSIAGAS